MRYLLLIPLILLSCKEKDKEQPTPIVITQKQPSTYDVYGTNVIVERNGTQHQVNSFTLNGSDTALVYSQITCTTYLNSDGSIKETDCNNYLKIYKDGQILFSENCKCSNIKYKITN